MRPLFFLLATLALIPAVALGAPPATPGARSPKRAAAAKPATGRGVLSARSQACVECHASVTPGLVKQWQASTHAARGVGCLECHQRQEGAADAFPHGDALVGTIVTPRDCGRCHGTEMEQFERSHHAKAGNILASLDNYIAETVEGTRIPFNPHGVEPGSAPLMVNGLASAQSGCQQCHGTKVALKAKDGGAPVTVDDLKPGPDGKPRDPAALARIARDADGKPALVESTWPNTGIGRINLDGSLGSCSACHSRHEFAPRRARQPENCGKCHLGPDHPQKEIFEESKHGIAYRDQRDQMKLDARRWVVGDTYSAAPTCSTCHMSANANGGKVTHDPGERLSWTNRPPVSLRMDTDAQHRVVTEKDPAKRKELVADTWQQKRERMKEVCTSCHASSYVDAFYKQYDDLVTLYAEKFALPGQELMKALKDNGIITPVDFDERIEWDWFYLWHHEGRRARMGVSMNAPDYAHWHGMYEVAEDFYQKLVPEARELIDRAAKQGKVAQAKAAGAVLDGILARPEHAWYLKQRAELPPVKGESARPPARGD
jgi:nitrate/TMAO reductase-like tetraheme cytochrome c subunit